MEPVSGSLPSFTHITSGDREQMACFVNEIRISEPIWLSLSYPPFGNDLPAQNKHSVPPRARSVHPHGKGHFSPMLLWIWLSLSYSEAWYYRAKILTFFCLSIRSIQDEREKCHLAYQLIICSNIALIPWAWKIYSASPNFHRHWWIYRDNLLASLSQGNDHKSWVKIPLPWLRISCSLCFSCV